MDDDLSLSADIFSYHAERRKRSAFVFITIIVFMVLVLALYLAIFRGENPFRGTIIQGFVVHIGYHISQFSYLGMFYVTLFGGLFFLPSAIEPAFVTSILNHNVALILLMTLLGTFISFSIDYILGYKFSAISRKLISVKQFYKIKSIINKRGSWAILFFNIIGMGSQQVTFIMGVFRYNKTRLFIMTALGQIIKYFALIFILMWF